MGSRDKAGLILKIDTDWLNANRGSKSKRGLTDFLFKNDKWDNEVAYVVPKKNAKSALVRSTEANATDILLGLGPINVDEYSDGGGQMTITKNPNGSYQRTGTYQFLNEETFAWETFAVSQTLPAGTPANAILNATRASLKDIRANNIQLRKNYSAIAGTKSPQKLLGTQ